MAGINTVLFDFDGTLMDTNAIILASWQHTFMTVEGEKRPEEEIIKTFGEPLFLTMKNIFPERDTEEVISIYRNFQHEKYADMISLFPGVTELLAGLKEQEYKIGLVTSRLTRSTMIGLDKFGIKKYFDAIVTADDTDKHKPDPEPALIALAKLNSKPEESIMLGDTMFDILCAKNAGIKSVLAGWSIAAPVEFKEGEDAPDYIISSANDLLKILSEAGNA